MENIDILCMNCEDMISEGLIEAHSYVCVTPQITLVKLASDNPFQHVLYRIDKARCGIEVCLLDSLREFPQGELFILESLLDYTDLLLSCSSGDPNTKSLCRSVEKCLTEINEEAVSLYTRLYEERIKLLAQELSRYPEVVELGYFDEPLSEISSKLNDTIVSRSELSYSTCHYAAAELQQNLRSVEEDSEYQESHEEEIEDKQRIFYSKCLSYKLSFPATHSAQTVPVALLYQKALFSRVPFSQWDFFIETEFGHPERWVPSFKRK